MMRFLKKIFGKPKQTKVLYPLNEDELEGELEPLVGTELEEQLVLSAATASAAPVHDIAGLLLEPPVPQGTDKEDELAFAG